MTPDTDVEIFKPGVPGLPSTAKVIALCAAKGLQFATTTYTSPPDHVFFIKYGSHFDLSEAHARRFFCDSVSPLQAHTVHIPEIYHAFKHDRTTYIVMEYVDFDRFADQAQKAEKVGQLLAAEMPPDARLGPVGGGVVHHEFFPESEAPYQFDPVQELERFPE